MWLREDLMMTPDEEFIEKLKNPDFDPKAEFDAWFDYFYSRIQGAKPIIENRYTKDWIRGWMDIQSWRKTQELVDLFYEAWND